MMDVLEYIGQFGFPALVTAYLLVRLDMTLKELSQEVHELLSEIRKST